jgi:aminocarboxymuconate-semialdehyde decarboxylase
MTIVAARVIDVHSHYLAPSLTAALAARTEPPRIVVDGGGRSIEYGQGSGHPLLAEMTELERQLRSMDEDGVEVAVLSTNIPGVDWFAPDDAAAIARDVNDELAAAVGAHPSRFAALAVLPMGRPERAAVELERAVANGLRGAMIYSNVAGEALDLNGARPVLEVAERLGVPVGIHPTFPLSAATMRAYALIPTLGFLVDTTTAALRLVLDGLFELFAELPLYLPHAGSLLPQLAGRADYEATRAGPAGLGAMRGLPSEHLRLIHTDAVCAWPPALRSALELFGPERVMFGGDYPFWERARTTRTLGSVELAPNERAAIERDNARRLFSLPAKGGRRWT